jgi:hypothetical protein
LLPRDIFLSGEVAAKVLFEAGQDMALVLTVASVVEPFLTLGHRTSSSISQVRYTCSTSISMIHVFA